VLFGGFQHVFSEVFVPSIHAVRRTTATAYHLSVLIMLCCYLMMIDSLSSSHCECSKGLISAKDVDILIIKYSYIVAEHIVQPSSCCISFD